MFSTLMFERHNTKIAVFGGKPGEQVQYKGNSSFSFHLTVSSFHPTRCIFSGMAGNQVLEWYDIDTEIKSAGLKDVSVVKTRNDLYIDAFVSFAGSSGAS